MDEFIMASNVPVPVSVSVPESNVLVSLPIESPSIESQFNSLLQDLSLFKTQLSDIQSKVRILEKTITKELKNKEKQEKKQEKKQTTLFKLQQPSGFDKVAPVSEELCLFLNKPNGSMLSRTEVTTAVTNYIRNHKLQNMTNRKKIMPNEALSTLLHLTENDELTYFNLQKYLSIHFV